jgi:hypothetical protein
MYSSLITSELIHRHQDLCHRSVILSMCVWCVVSGLDRTDGSICVFVFNWDEALTVLHCR